MSIQIIPKSHHPQHHRFSSISGFNKFSEPAPKKNIPAPLLINTENLKEKGKQIHKRYQSATDRPSILKENLEPSLNSFNKLHNLTFAITFNGKALMKLSKEYLTTPGNILIVDLQKNLFSQMPTEIMFL